MAGNDQDAHFEAIIGTTGCGKSTQLRKRLGKIPAKKKKRILCYSPKERIDNYAGWLPGAVLCHTVSDVLRIVKKAGRNGSFCIVFAPSLNRKADEAAFDVLCRIALEAGNLILIAEELHTVTRPSWAPDGWSNLCFMGRGFGVWVFGLSQRPASMDKDFLGSVSFVHCGRLPIPDDQKFMARSMGVAVDEIARLTGYQAIQKDMTTGGITRAL